MRYPRNLALVADSINCETSIPPRSHEHDSLLWRGRREGGGELPRVELIVIRNGEAKNIARPFLWFQWFGLSFGMEVFKEFRDLVFSRMFEWGGDSREEKGSWTLFCSFRPPPSSRGIDVILFHHFATMIWKEYLCGFNYGAPIKTLSLPRAFSTRNLSSSIHLSKFNLDTRRSCTVSRRGNAMCREKRTNWRVVWPSKGAE